MIIDPCVPKWKEAFHDFITKELSTRAILQANIWSIVNKQKQFLEFTLISLQN